ncbi:hypothetical protein EI427_11635 [Flammeovirga pectinis]|uniref:Uncharacterized protein n=2 Tax=Flammeovirga pectinis TaxID=2494373 RepID=A0A3Q9FR78_9BACT|nr:hypothetical protein EI427_11635 [Flammeovirga pectinis]
MKKTIIYILPILALFISCDLTDDEPLVLTTDPITHVFHDAQEVEVEDSLSQLSIDVKIVGWKKDERGYYNLHYRFVNLSSNEVDDKNTISYKKIQIKDDVLTENLFFEDLDSLTDYKIELKSSYKDEFTSSNFYNLSTKGIN